MDVPASNFLGFIAPENVAQLTLRNVVVKLLAILFFVAANAFFVGSEFALVSVRRPRLQVRAEGGSGRAQAALRLLGNPTLFISATQLGITIASLALGWIGEPTIASLLEPAASLIAPQGKAAYAAHLVAIVIAFASITFMHIVLGELMPKMIALERAETLALFAARPLELFARIFRVPLWTFNQTGKSLGRLIGLKSSLEHAAVYNEEELRQLIDISRERGHLRAEERRLIHRVFEFSETLVREAMVPRTAMAAVAQNSSLEEIVGTFQRCRYSRLPVYRGSLDDVLGFVHVKDVLSFLTHPERFALEKVLQPPMYVVDTARLEDVLRQMQKAKTHFGFVVGEISDEHDEEVNEQIAEINERTYALDGSLAVRDLNRRLKTAIPESEGYTTIGGFLMSVAGHVLQPGEVVIHNGLRFYVEKVERRRVLQVRMELIEKPKFPDEESAAANLA